MYIINKEEDEVIYRADVTEENHVVKLIPPKETLASFVFIDNGNEVEIYLKDRSCIKLNYEEVEALQILLQVGSTNTNYISFLEEI